MLERPAPLNAGLCGYTYCDGPDNWWKGCGICASCGGAIAVNERTGRRAQWFCTNPDCRLWWAQNHQWTVARETALERDRRCRRCGINAGAQIAAPGGAGSSRTVRLEVNHIRALADTEFDRGPEGGANTKYRTGCANHLDNLEVLCRADHGIATAEQRRARETKKGAAA